MIVYKRAVPHLIALKVVSTIADAAKKRKKVDINVKHSQEPQLKKLPWIEVVLI